MSKKHQKSRGPSRPKPAQAGPREPRPRGGGSLKTIQNQNHKDNRHGHSNTPTVPQGHGGGYIKCQQIIAFACSGSIEAIMLSDSTPISACEKGGQWQ